MWLREGVGNVLGVLGVFSFNSIKGKWPGNEREMGNVPGSCLVVSFYFSRVKILGNGGVFQFPGFIYL